MLDIKFIRENKDIIKAGAEKKHIPFDVEALVTIDDKRIELLKVVEGYRSEQNAVSEKIPTASPESRATLIEEMKVVKEKLVSKEIELGTVMDEWKRLMLQVPNVPDITVPEGESDEQNLEIKTWGKFHNLLLKLKIISHSANKMIWLTLNVVQKCLVFVATSSKTVGHCSKWHSGNISHKNSSQKDLPQ